MPEDERRPDLGEASAIRWPVLRRTYAVVRD